MGPDGERCDECRFWVRKGPDKDGRQALSGLCHRYPKIVTKMTIEWCGEFSPARRTEQASQ